MSTGKYTLSYHQLCTWSCSLHCGEWHLASYQFGQGCSVGKASNNWCCLPPPPQETRLIQAITATWERTQLLPDPPKFPELEGELPEPMACSLHFLGGGDVLLITYMDHGVM
jgi:hypothetical protein